MTRKIAIESEEIVRDIRQGMSNFQLEQKYQISPNQLQSAFTLLLKGKYMEVTELQDRMTSDSGTQDYSDRRVTARNYLTVPVFVYDANFPDSMGRVIDLTEKGLMVIGMESKVGDVRSLLMRSEDYANVGAVGFYAVCRWADPKGIDNEFTVGFEITEIAPGGLQELQKMIEFLTLRDS
jgi:hypothetical protein